MNSSQNSNQFLGYNGAIWGHAVVEDIGDPLKLGRVRVRVAGFHTDDKVDIPTEHLPWSMVLMPVTSASMSGIGETPHGLLPGSWVMVVARDGAHAQDFVVIGSLYGDIDAEPNYSKGFSDPNKIYPRFNKETPRGTWFPTTDVNQLEFIDAMKYTVVDWKKNTRIKSIQRCFPFETYPEPVSPWAPEYTFNNVKETRSGHIVEIDDTPQAERIHTFHKSGTYDEIGPDGSKVVRIVGDDYEIVLKDKNLAVQGNLNITVQGDVTLVTNGNLEHRVKGQYNLALDEDFNITTKGAMNIRADQGFNLSSGNNVTLYSAEKTTISSQDKMVITSGDELTLSSEEELDIVTEENIYIHSQKQIVAVTETKEGYIQFVALEAPIYLQGDPLVYLNDFALDTLPLEELPPDTEPGVNPGDRIPGRRTDLPTKLLDNMDPESIKDNYLNITDKDHNTQDRVQFLLGDKYT